MLQFLEQFSGLFGLLFFVSTIFEYSGSSISPNVSSIIVGVIQIIGCYCSTLLVDRAGRKILISTSAFGISIGMFVFALYSYLNDHGYELTSFNWIPLVSFSFTLWIANLGVLSLPFLVTSELIITLPNVSEPDKGRLPMSTATFTFFRFSIFLDKRAHLHLLLVPLVGVCFRDSKILRDAHRVDRNERLDVDFLDQLPRGRNLCCRSCTGDEGAKLPRDPRNAWKVISQFNVGKHKKSRRINNRNVSHGNDD